MSQENAKQLLLSEVKEQLKTERAVMIRDSEQEAELSAERNAKN